MEDDTSAHVLNCRCSSGSHESFINKEGDNILAGNGFSTERNRYDGIVTSTLLTFSHELRSLKEGDNVVLSVAVQQRG